MSKGIFQCGVHDFSTDDIKKWDKHCEENEHEYDLQTECDCGKKIHLRPKVKLSPKAKRIPRSALCDDCKKAMMNVSEIKVKVVSK